MFERFGGVGKLNVKKNKNGIYSFAFLEFDSAEAASTAIKELDQFELFGKRMRVYLSKPFSRQDRQSEGCFHCKRPGHFAKECPLNRDSRDYQRGRYYLGYSGRRQGGGSIARKDLTDTTVTAERTITGGSVTRRDIVRDTARIIIGSMNTVKDDALPLAPTPASGTTDGGSTALTLSAGTGSGDTTRREESVVGIEEERVLTRVLRGDDLDG